MNDRAADIWEPLLALAELAGGDWPERARQAAVGLTASAQEESPIGALLFDILMCFVKSEAERIFSRTLVGALNLMEDRPWAEMRRGKAVTELWLARQLRPYGVRPRTIWIGENAAKGYVEKDFGEAFGRYIPKAQAKALLEEAVGAAGPAKRQENPEEGQETDRAGEDLAGTVRTVAKKPGSAPQGE